MSDRRDVVIFNIETKQIDTIAGTDLTLDGPRNSVSTRLATVLPRLNDHYDACSVPAGKYKNGDKLEPADQSEDWSESRKALTAQD